MSKNEIAAREHVIPSVFQDKTTAKIRIFAEYEKINDADYSFISRPDQDTEIRIVPNTIGASQGEMQTDAANAAADDGISEEPAAVIDDMLDAGYEESVPQKERPYYSLALACGLLCAALKQAPSVYSGFDFDAYESFESGHKGTLRDIVVFAAQLDGFKGKDTKKAIKHLLSMDGPRAASQLHDIFPDALEKEAELSARPSMSGLLFSLLSQFSGMLYYADDKGDLWEHPVPDHYVIGDSKEDKILAGIMYWFFHASVISVRLGEDALKDKKIPDAIRSLISDLISLSDLSGMPGEFEGAEIRYSEWLGRMILLDREDDTEGMELFFILREKMNCVCSDTFPLVLNNCLMRAVYILCRMRSEGRNLSAPSFMDILAIDPDKILPRDQQILSNMCLISAGAFKAVNIGHAVLDVLLKSKERPGDKEIKDFISAVNIGGIGNFNIALAENAVYEDEKIEVFLNSARWTRYRNTTVPGNPESGGSFFFEKEIRELLDEIMLDPVQLHLMYSLENLLVEYDISDTEKEEEIRLKKQWLDEWKRIVGSAVQEPADSWLITEEKVLFEDLSRLSRESENPAWIYLLILELKIFTPYSELGTGSDKDCRSLKSNTDYVKDTLIRMQTVVTQDEADRMKKLYEKYLGIMNGRSLSHVNGAGEVIEAAAAGGAAVTMMAAMLTTSEGLWDEQYAKLLVYGRYILRGCLDDEDGYRILRGRISAVRQQVENQFRDMKEEKNSLDRKMISLTGSFLKYLRRLDTEMQKK